VQFAIFLELFLETLPPSISLVLLIVLFLDILVFVKLDVARANLLLGQEQAIGHDDFVIAAVHARAGGRCRPLAPPIALHALPRLLEQERTFVHFA